MNFSRFLLSCVLSLSVSVPAICSSENIDVIKLETPCQDQRIISFSSLMALANAGDEKAQDKIVKDYFAEESAYINFKAINLDAWTSLGKCEIDNPVADQYIRFAIQIGKTEIYERYPNLILNLKHRAEQGSLDAMCNLGVFYDRGVGQKQDYTEAAKWFKMAADRGLARAQTNLGLMYEEGHGVDQSILMAMMLYKKAAKQGYAWAQNNLGLLYKENLAGNENQKKAIKWFSRAADQNFADAFCNLGELYEEALGFEQNLPEAIKCYKRAAELGYPRGLSFIGSKYESGIVVEKNIEIAIGYYTSAAELDYGWAQAQLGTIYELGLGVDQNYADALKWYTKATENKNVLAICNLAYMYRDALGIEKNFQEAIRLFKIGIEMGDAAAINGLGECCSSFYNLDDAESPEYDDREAFKLFSLAAEKGSEDAKVNIGLSYLMGAGVPVNIAEALRYLIDSGNKGFEEYIKDYFLYNVDAPRAEFVPTRAKAYSALSKLYYFAHQYGIYEEARIINCLDEPILSVAPVLRPLCVAFKEFVNDFAGLEANLQGLPVLMNTFAQTDNFPELLQNQMAPAFLHSYALDGESYLTMGEKNVKKISSIDRLMDESKTVLGDKGKFEAIPYLLLSNAMWNVAQKLIAVEVEECKKLEVQLAHFEGQLKRIKASKGPRRHKSAQIRYVNAVVDDINSCLVKHRKHGNKSNEALCNKLAEEACTEINFSAIETMGQARSCLKLFDTCYDESIDLLNRYNALYRESLKEDGIVYGDALWSQLVDGTYSRLRMAQDQLNGSFLRKFPDVMLLAPAPLQLLDEAKEDLQARIKNDVAERNDICLKDRLYGALFKVMTEANAEDN